MGKIINLMSCIFGYGLNFIDSKVQIYGISIILFTILIKLIFLKWEISQRKLTIKNEKIQKELDEIKEKYKNNQQVINLKTIELYKREKVNPCSSIFFMIFQILLLFALIDLVYSPLTYIKKIPKEKLSNIKKEYVESLPDKEKNKFKYGIEIDIQKKLSNKYPEIKTNYNFFGIDLSEKPSNKVKNIKELYKYENFKYILIPMIYIAVAFINMHISMKEIEKQRNKSKEENIIKSNENEKLNAKDFQDALIDSQKMMKYFFPVLIFSVTMTTPTVIALYWLVSSILDIGKIQLINIILEKEKAKEKE